ncbi:MAG: DUF4450 domain-containing protein [Prevotella sp.]|nr:DUF4450 domain-containing protein [Prevotella sp.]
MRKLYLLLAFLTGTVAYAQKQKVGDFIESKSYNLDKIGVERSQQYFPMASAFVCENGKNRFTRALYGGWTDYRIETSDRPVFAIVKKNHHRHLRFVVNGVPLDSTDYSKAYYTNGMRRYLLRDARWGEHQMLELQVVASPDREGAVWWFRSSWFKEPVRMEARMCEIANPKLHRNGDIGADKPGVFEAAPGEKGLQRYEWLAPAMDGSHEGYYSDTYFVIDSINQIVALPVHEARDRFAAANRHNMQLCQRIRFQTPDPYINTLGSALALAADGDWDGKTWLHGCVGWRMPLAGWRAAYVGDVLGWNDRQRSHFDAYAKSQVTGVEPTIPHPSQDPTMQMARAEKRWGTQMYSNGYICRNPERNDQMHHYDMNLNYMDELLWHFQYDADTLYMRQMWPVIKSHLAWEKRNYDPDGDHLYDAYCCIWASDALYYSGGAVTHSSAYNYRGNRLAARIADIIGENSTPYREEADAILKAMNERLWMTDNGVWAEYQDVMGLKRLHESPAVWSVYTPIDCGACSPEQAWQATGWVSSHIPHIDVEKTGYQTIATSNWMPYSWSINNVAAAEVMHTALAFFEAGRSDEGYRLLMGNVMDQMYYGQCPGNFGQISYYDAARGECYRDFGDCIGISSRTLVQGLFGIIPQALDGCCIIRPGFPSTWDSVSVTTPYLSYKYTRKDGVEHYDISQNFRQPLKIIIRQNLDKGQYRDTEGSSELHQVIEVTQADRSMRLNGPKANEKPRYANAALASTAKPRLQKFDKVFNARVDEIFKNQYLSPRPQTTTLQIPVQGIGEWCHPQLTADINDSVFRSLIVRDHIVVANIPFHTPRQGPNIVYTSLWDNYPDAVAIPLKGSAAVAHLLMAGSTNHMQSRIANGLVIVSYQDNTTDTLVLRNPDNWCPIEQDYYIDGKAFYAADPRPLRVCLGKATEDGKPVVSRNLGRVLGIKGVYGREIPGGAAQILSMPLNPQKKLRSLTVRTLSNDVVIGLMAVTLQ